MQLSIYKSVREGVEVSSEEAQDGDYVKATSENRQGLLR